MVHCEDPNRGDLVAEEELGLGLTAQSLGLTITKIR